MTENLHITQLLVEWSEGDENALDKLLPLVENELRHIAHNYMRRENPEHTLQTTALINEAYLKLINQKSVQWQNRAHFFAISAKIMRRILLNHARDAVAAKRGGAEAAHVNLDDATVFSPERSSELLALDEALERLAQFDSIKSRIVELRYFGGLSLEETAEVLKISPSSVSLHWRLAKAWLKDAVRSAEQ
jgi:RNA polymerase sigma-70 factor, ECF subfamily